MTRQIAFRDKYLDCQKLDASDNTSPVTPRLPQLETESYLQPPVLRQVAKGFMQHLLSLHRESKVCLKSFPNSPCYPLSRQHSMALSGQTCAAVLLLMGQGLTGGVILGGVSCQTPSLASGNQW